MRDVSQISPPIRIVLVVAVAFMALYMLFLRPKEEVIPPATAPATATQPGAVSEPGKVKEAAEGAVNAADGQLAQQESVDGVDPGETAATGTGTGTSTATAPAATGAAAAIAGDLEGLPKPVARAIRKDKVLVILFWNGKSADDKAVRTAVSDINRWDGRVAVHVAPLKQISKYGRIARGVDVEQSPTIVIADRDLRAETLVGYVDRATIDQAVVDALRNSDGLFTSTYLKSVDQVCRRYSNAHAMIPNLYPGSVGKADARVAAVTSSSGGLVGELKAVKAPRKWRAFHAASVADVSAVHTALTRFSASITPKSSPSSIAASLKTYRQTAKAPVKRADKRFDSRGLYRCGSGF